MANNYLLIGIGGAIGATLRVFLSGYFPSHLLGIPLQIMIVNFIGCILIGSIVELVQIFHITSSNIKNFLIPGFLGGFTTFSSFAMESGDLYNKQQYILCISYIFLSVASGLLFFIISSKVTRYLLG